MSISHRALGAYGQEISGGVTPGLPAGVAAGDMMLMFVGGKEYSLTFDTPSGWTKLTDGCGSNGTTASGPDTGSVAWAVYYREWQSGDAAPTINVTNQNSCMAVIDAFKKTSSTWATPVATKGQDTSGDSATITFPMAANPGIVVGDMVFAACVIAGNDGVAFSTRTFTATGATFGSATGGGTSTSQGNDTRYGTSYALCTAGPATDVPTATFLTDTNQTGGCGFIRLRELGVAHDATTVLGGDSISSLSWTHTPVGTPSAAGVHFDYYATAAINSVTYGGTGMTQAKQEINLGSNIGVAIYGLANPSSGAQTVVITFSGTTYGYAAATTVRGSDTSTTFSNTASAQGASGDPATVTCTSATNELVIDCVGHDGSSGFNIGAGQTQLYASAFVVGLYYAAGSCEPGAASVVMSWSQSSLKWTIAAASFKEAAAGGAVVKTVDDLALASVKTMGGLAIGSVKTIGGAAAQ